MNQSKEALERLFGVALRETEHGSELYRVQAKLPDFKFIAIDYGSDEMSAATYCCRQCDRLHHFTHRPETLPHSFACECGNAITVGDPILRALPRSTAMAKFETVRKAILDQLGEPLSETDIDDAAHAAIKAAQEIPPEVATGLRETFGYVPDEQSGERWTVYQDHTLIVIHPERRPRLYQRGCQGLYSEIEPRL